MLETMVGKKSSKCLSFVGFYAGVLVPTLIGVLLIIAVIVLVIFLVTARKRVSTIIHNTLRLNFDSHFDLVTFKTPFY